MGSKYILGFVIFQELGYSVWTEFDNVTSSIWISNEVRLNSKFLIIISWIRPQNVYN